MLSLDEFHSHRQIVGDSMRFIDDPESAAPDFLTETVLFAELLRTVLYKNSLKVQKTFFCNMKVLSLSKN